MAHPCTVNISPIPIRSISTSWMITLYCVAVGVALSLQPLHSSFTAIRFAIWVAITLCKTSSIARFVSAYLDMLWYRCSFLYVCSRLRLDLSFSLFIAIFIFILSASLSQGLWRLSMSLPSYWRCIFFPEFILQHPNLIHGWELSHFGLLWLLASQSHLVGRGRMSNSHRLCLGSPPSEVCWRRRVFLWLLPPSVDGLCGCVWKFGRHLCSFSLWLRRKFAILILCS